VKLTDLKKNEEKKSDFVSYRFHCFEVSLYASSRRHLQNQTGSLR